MTMTRRCPKCGVVKDIGHFYRNGICVDGTPKYQSYCRECKRAMMMARDKAARNAYVRKLYHADPERYRGYSTTWRAKRKTIDQFTTEELLAEIHNRSS